MRALLHPPAHRGPLIAAGALVLAMGVALQQLRTSPGAGAQLAVVAALAVALLWLALQRDPSPPTHAPHAPHAHESVLVVLALVAAGAALLRAADLLSGLDGRPSGAVAWTSACLGALAVYASVRRRSAVAALIAAVAGGLALLAAWDWLFDPASDAPFRWLLLLLAFAYGIASLPLRGTSARHAEQMVNATGLATLAIGLLGGWPFVALVAGVALVAYAAADHVPGPAYLGAANLAAFLYDAGAGRGLVGWPLVLLVVGGVMVLVGLRPRRPLPPEPASSTRPDDQPLTVRAREEES